MAKVYISFGLSLIRLPQRSARACCLCGFRSYCIAAAARTTSQYVLYVHTSRDRSGRLYTTGKYSIAIVDEVLWNAHGDDGENSEFCGLLLRYTKTSTWLAHAICGRRIVPGPARAWVIQIRKWPQICQWPVMPVSRWARAIIR